MAANPLLTRWRAGQTTLGGWMVTDDPQVAEFLAQAGFDEICVDQQHGLADDAAIGALFRAIEVHGVAPTTRVTTNDAAAIGKALDLGALAIVVPMVGTAEEAAYAVAACHYPPRGVRSVGPVRGVQARSSHRLEGLDEVACVVMVETADGCPERGRDRRHARASTASTSVRATWRSDSGCRRGTRTGRQRMRRSTPMRSSASVRRASATGSRRGCTRAPA